MSEQRNIERFGAVDNLEEMEASPIEPAAITNIYYDCLERIFDFLDLESLLNVAKTCKRLQIAAAANFDDRFGKKIVELYDVEESDEIKVDDWVMILPFLRCFGSKIFNLKVNYMNEKRINLILRYISAKLKWLIQIQNGIIFNFNQNVFYVQFLLVY